MRRVCEKYQVICKYIFREFMDLEIGYAVIDRHGMRQMLRVYRVGGKLLKALKSFYVYVK